jgi:hypothetical protein
VAKVSFIPAVKLVLTEIEYRRVDPSLNFPDSFEVVVQGRLVNNTQYDVLLTCRDHPNSGRDWRRPVDNEGVFFIGGNEVSLGWAVLAEEQEASFMWIDRRPKADCIDIYNLNNRHSWIEAPELNLPRLKWHEMPLALWRYRSFYWARQEKVKRSGFLLACDSRMTERVTTVWQAEVVRTPIETFDRDENGKIVFKEWVGTLPGPLDDSILYYRIRFDSTLASVRPRKRSTVQGRA